MSDMPVEQRVVASVKPKIGVRPAPAPPTSPAPDGEKPKRGRKKRWVVLVLLLVLAGAAAWWFLLGPGGAPAADDAAPPPPEPGLVLMIEPISLNLADGHYLRLGLGLQLTKDVGEEPDTARALDQAVSLFSGRPVAEVGSTEGREALRTELLTRLTEAYEGEVMDVYFTDYVTQ
jgi:flagellar FliL protein